MKKFSFLPEFNKMRNQTVLLILLIGWSISVSLATEAERTDEHDHPTRWNYEALRAWDKEKGLPKCFGTGKGVGIAVIEGPNFNIKHPVFEKTNITLIDFGGDNVSSRDSERVHTYHANHVTALIAGSPQNVPVVEPVDFCDLMAIKQNNPLLYQAYKEADTPIPSFYFYGGMAPEAQIYAYARKLDHVSEGNLPMDRECLLKIFSDIAQRPEIQLVNLSCRLAVDKDIITVLNECARQGKIFIQAASNDYELICGLSGESWSKRTDSGLIQFFGGSSPDSFLPIFKENIVRVGALACSKTPKAASKVILWQNHGEFNGGSSYFPSGDQRYVLAPGSCILSADQEGYVIRSGCSVATPFVTGALANALERDIYLDRQVLLSSLSCANKTFEIEGQHDRTFSYFRMDSLFKSLFVWNKN